MTEKAMDSPGVQFPPPIVYVLGFGIGWLVSRRVPLAFLPEEVDAVGVVVGLVFIVLGLSVMMAGLITFKRANTAVMPNQGASRLVRSGPYRFTRNPMYVGLTAAYVGGSLYTNLLWPLLLLPGVLFVIVRFVISREERYLRAAFGTEYEAFCREVRRWI